MPAARRSVPLPVRAVFLEALRREFGAVLDLPPRLPLGHLLFVDATGADRVRAVPARNGTEYVLDVYVSRVGTFHPGCDEIEIPVHRRIREDGSVHDLENFEGLFGVRAFPNNRDTERERHRVQAHNDRVRAILYRKGFWAERGCVVYLGELGFARPVPSASLDPGQWLVVADEYAFRPDGTRDDLQQAIAAVRAILAFVPEGADRVPDEAFRTGLGQTMRAEFAWRFARAHLQGMLDAYEALLVPAAAGHDAPPNRR